MKFPNWIFEVIIKCNVKPNNWFCTNSFRLNQPNLKTTQSIECVCVDRVYTCIDLKNTCIREDTNVKAFTAHKELQIH